MHMQRNYLRTSTSVVTTSPHSLSTACSTITTCLTTFFSSALVPLGNELTSLSIQSTPSRTRLPLSLGVVAGLNIVVSSPALSCISSATSTRNAGATLSLLLLLLLLLSGLRTERIMRLLHATASSSTSSSCDRQPGLESSQGSLTISGSWRRLIWQR